MSESESEENLEMMQDGIEVGMVVETNGSVLKAYTCGAKCHIRCKKCPNCDTEFTVRTKDFPPEKLVRKHPSSLWRQIQLKVKQMHFSFGHDVVILVHKENTTRRSWHTFTTPGPAEAFLNSYPAVSQLWEKHIRNYKNTAASANTGDTASTSITEEEPVHNTGVTSTSTSGVTSICIHNTGVTPTSTSGVTSVHNTGVIPTSTSGVTSVRNTGVTPTSTSGVTSVHNTGVTPTSTNGVTSIHNTGMTPTSISAVTSICIHNTGVTPTSTSGVTSIRNAGVTSTSTSGVTSVRNAGVTSTSTSGVTLTNTSAAGIACARGLDNMAGNKRKRCKICDGCKAPKCLSCKFCLNPRLKKPCIKRICKQLQ